MTTVNTLYGGNCSREIAVNRSGIDCPYWHKFETNLSAKCLVGEEQEICQKRACRSSVEVGAETDGRDERGGEREDKKGHGVPCLYGKFRPRPRCLWPRVERGILPFGGRRLQRGRLSR